VAVAVDAVDTVDTVVAVDAVVAAVAVLAVDAVVAVGVVVAVGDIVAVGVVAVAVCRLWLRLSLLRLLLLLLLLRLCAHVVDRSGEVGLGGVAGSRFRRARGGGLLLVPSLLCRAVFIFYIFICLFLKKKLIPPPSPLSDPCTQR
jgi:hypothetical protein